jgi:hypothetical protein
LRYRFGLKLEILFGSFLFSFLLFGAELTLVCVGFSVATFSLYFGGLFNLLSKVFVIFLGMPLSGCWFLVFELVPLFFEFCFPYFEPFYPCFYFLTSEDLSLIFCCIGSVLGLWLILFLLLTWFFIG